MQQPETKPLLALPPPAPPASFAMIVTMIEQDKISHQVRLFVGGDAQSADMTWTRVGPASWETKDAGWFEAEDRIGTELAEYLDEMPFPDAAAAALPRPGQPIVAVGDRACPAAKPADPNATGFLLEVGVLPDGRKVAYASANGARNGQRLAGPKATGSVRSLAVLEFSEVDLLAFIDNCAPHLRKQIPAKPSLVEITNSAAAAANEIGDQFAAAFIDQFAVDHFARIISKHFGVDVGVDRTSQAVTA